METGIDKEGFFCRSPSAAAQSFFWFWIGTNFIILVTSKKSFHSSKTKDALQNRRNENHSETSPSSWWLPVVAMSFAVSHEAAAQEDAPCLSSTSLPKLSPLPGRNPSHSKPEEEENFEGRGDSLRKNKRYYHRLLGGRD